MKEYIITNRTTFTCHRVEYDRVIITSDLTIGPSKWIQSVIHYYYSIVSGEAKGTIVPARIPLDHAIVLRSFYMFLTFFFVRRFS